MFEQKTENTTRDGLVKGLRPCGYGGEEEKTILSTVGGKHDL